MELVKLKKFFCLLLVCLMTLGVSGCSSSQTNVEIATELISDDVMQIGFCFVERTDYIIDYKNKFCTNFSGKAEIIIKDENENEIFSNTFDFSPKNISDDFTYTYVEGNYYVFDVYINEFKRSTSERGTISAKITLEDGTIFNSEGTVYYGLPFYYDIKLPSIPATFSDFTYPGEKIFKITKLEQKPAGDDNAYFDLQFKLIDMVKSDYSSVDVSIGYKVYDSNGVVVDDGTVTSNSLSIGESSNTSFTIYDLDPLETYTLKLISVK